LRSSIAVSAGRIPPTIPRQYRRDLRQLLRARHGRGRRHEALGARVVGADQFDVYRMTEGQEQTLETYGKEIIPRFAGVAT
jgi:hypothetical protein